MANYRVRIEELPVVGGFLFTSFERDFTDFSGYSPDFNQAYKDNFTVKLEAADEIVNPKGLQKELKKVTDRMYATIDGMRPKLNLLEGYVNRAADNLNMLPGDFGIKPVRDKISNKDQEALLQAMKDLIKNVDDNFAALEAKGLTQAGKDNIVATRQSIKDDNQLQNKLLNDRSELVDENEELS